MIRLRPMSPPVIIAPIRDHSSVRLRTCACVAGVLPRLKKAGAARKCVYIGSSLCPENIPFGRGRRSSTSPTVIILWVSSVGKNRFVSLWPDKARKPPPPSICHVRSRPAWCITSLFLRNSLCRSAAGSARVGSMELPAALARRRACLLRLRSRTARPGELSPHLPGRKKYTCMIPGVCGGESSRDLPEVTST